MESNCAYMWVNVRIKGTFTRTCLAMERAVGPNVDKAAHVFHWMFRRFCTSCAHELRIEFLPDISDLLTDSEVKFDGALDFFDRVDGCRVVLSPEFAGDLGEAEM